MNSSQGLESDFDVLHSQLEKNPYVHQIPIKKIGFEGVKQPTDLPLGDFDHNEDEEIFLGHEEEVKFEVPRKLLDYLDNLIYAKKLPLRTLKFDIEFSKSIQEIAGFLEAYVEKSHVLEESDLDKLFGFIGYGKTVTPEVESVEVEEVHKVEVKKEVEKAEDGKPHHSRIEEFFDPEGVAKENLDFARREYIEILKPSLDKNKKDKAIYAKIMAELGGNEDMPEKDEPKELKIARKEYEKTKVEAFSGLEGEIRELEVFKNKLLELFEERSRKIVERSLVIFDNYQNNVLVSEGLLSGDISEVDKIVNPNSFTGMRTEKTPISEDSGTKLPERPKVSPVDIDVAIKEALAQNVISLDWEGKRIEIKQAGEAISVFLEGKEIAGGFMSPHGPKVRINKEYNSGFFLADTVQEKALKFAKKTIEKLK